MIVTKKLGLKLPQASDLVDEADYNGNFQTVENYVTTLTQAASVYAPFALNLTNTWQTITFNTLVKTGYAFAISGGGIKLLESGFIKVQAHVYANSLIPGESIEVNIVRNGTVVDNYASADVDTSYVVYESVSKLTPAAKNDIITVQVRNWQNVRGKISPPDCFMTVDLYKNLNFAS